MEKSYEKIGRNNTFNNIANIVKYNNIIMVYGIYYDICRHGSLEGRGFLQSHVRDCVIAQKSNPPEKRRSRLLITHAQFNRAAVATRATFA